MSKNQEDIIKKLSTGAIFDSYQKLTTNQKKHYLLNVLDKDFDKWFGYENKSQIESLLFFLKEYLKHNLKQEFSDSHHYNQYLHNIFYSPGKKPQEELKIKKETIEILISEF